MKRSRVGATTKRTKKGFYPIYPAAKITKVEVGAGEDLPYGTIKVDSWIEADLWYWAREALHSGIITGFWLHPEAGTFKFKVDSEGKITYRPDFVVTTNTSVMEQFCQWEQWDMPADQKALLLPPHRVRDRVYLIEAKGSWAYAKGSVIKPFLDKQTHLRQKGVPVNLVFPDQYTKNNRKYSGLFQQTFCPTALATKFGGKSKTALFERSGGTPKDVMVRDVNRTMVTVTANTIPDCPLFIHEDYLVSNWINGTIMFYSPNRRYHYTLRAGKGEPWPKVRERHGWGTNTGPDTHQNPGSFSAQLLERKGLLVKNSKGTIRMRASLYLPVPFFLKA